MASSPFRSPLYRRLLLWFCIANVATLMVSVAVTQHISRRVFGAVDPDWAALAQGADAAYEKGGAPGLAQWSEQVRRSQHVEITLYEGGRSLLEHPWPPPMQRVLPLLLSSENMVLRPMPGLMLAAQRVVGADGVTRQMVALRPPHPPNARLDLLLDVEIALSVLAIGVVGWLVARSISRPLAALQEAAQRMAAGELSARVGAPYAEARDEVGLLARDFNHMAGRIQELVAHERSVLQDVSHELRSPLARLQLILELARRDNGAQAGAQLAQAEREIGRLDRLIDQLLALSRMEADLPGMTRERVDLAALAADCVGDAEIEARAHGVALRLDAPARLEVQGEEQLLARALDNLLANAIKFGGGGEVVVSLARRGAQAELSVRDHGPGVPAPELARLFQPFFRGANARGVDGHGLGLAIVARVARAHGGSVGAANAEGGGLRVVLSLPVAA